MTNVLGLKTSRLLKGHEETQFEQKYLFLKEKLVGLVDEDDRMFLNRLKACMQDENFKRQFILLMDPNNFNTEYIATTNHVNYKKKPHIPSESYASTVTFDTNNVCNKLNPYLCPPRHEYGNINQYVKPNMHSYVNKNVHSYRNQNMHPFKNQKVSSIEKTNMNPSGNLNAHQYRKRNRNLDKCKNERTSENKRTNQIKNEYDSGNKKSKKIPIVSGIINFIKKADSNYEAQLIDVLLKEKNNDVNGKEPKMSSKDMLKMLSPIIKLSMISFITLLFDYKIYTIPLAFILTSISILYVTFKYKKVLKYITSQEKVKKIEIKKANNCNKGLNSCKFINKKSLVCA
ncbi:hypothetical protein, conserved [Plasmodium gonderi]|uniref:Pv-fam-d protein n=1 Tax=Plasmodium gonderi TaxID=77519 RepID=A0A1Y1JNC0_PLAGO|nr:hypothetical protein, conserved [Plasmodium gonderi]GAW82727.1 hypothetical protein, conserved [Plasmodium gonderi]